MHIITRGQCILCTKCRQRFIQSKELAQFSPATISVMFAATLFALNTATAALAGVAVRAITTKTTTIIKG